MQGGAAVQPHQVSAFQRQRLHHRQFLPKVGVHQLRVLVKIGAERIQPFLGLVVRGLQGGAAEYVHVAALVVVDGPVNAADGILVGGEYVRDLDAGDVERLGRGDAGRGIAHQLLRQRGKRRIVVTGIGELAMDLVGNDENAVLEADPADTLQFLPRPYAPGRIVRIA